LLVRVQTKAGLLVDLTQQLHQVLAIHGRKFPTGFPLQAGASLTASCVALKNFKQGSLLWAGVLRFTSKQHNESRA
jgi:hypothetical protein